MVCSDWFVYKFDMVCLLDSTLQLFSDVFVEDPLFVCEIAQTMVLNQDSQGANKSQKEKQLYMVNTMGREY